MSLSSRESRRQEVFGAVRDLGPSELIQFLEQTAALLPEDFQLRLREVISSAPLVGDNLQRVLELVRRQWEGLQSEEWVRIAIVGPARTGKMTLMRALVGDRVDRARPIFTVIDTQGLDEFLGYRKRDSIPEEILDVDVILFVLDAEFEFTEDTIQMVQVFKSLGKAFLVVLNKMDLVRRKKQRVAQAKRQFGVPVVPTSALRRRSITSLLKSVVSIYPKALYPLSRNFPEFRKSICSSIVGNAAFGSGLVGAIPLPVSDMLPISAIQVAMILKIARIYGLRVERGRARELVPMLLAGYVVREGCHRLTERYPQHKTLISVSTGGAWTYMVGKAAESYFERLSAVLNRAELPPTS